MAKHLGDGMKIIGEHWMQRNLPEVVLIIGEHWMGAEKSP
jgi:hypothetical protein